MKNKKTRVLLLAGIALLGLCACGAFLMLFVVADRDGETAERAVEVTALATEAEPGTDATIAQPQELTETEASSPTALPPVAPTDTPEPTSTPEPSPTPQPEPGMSRSNPVPMADVVEAPNWTIEVLEVVRGEEAWATIQAVNRFNDPPPDGMQYVLVRLKATSMYNDSESHSIGQNDFRLTGDRLILYDNAPIVVPEPELNAELYAGGVTEGWVALMAGQDEGQLMLVVDELLNFDDERYRFVALDPDAAVSVDSALFDVAPTGIGRTRNDPVSPGSPATTENWEITVTEIIRGQEAWTSIQAANQFNEPPPEGMEYVAVKLQVRYIGTADRPGNIDGSHFALTGEQNILYDWPAVVDPEPELDVSLFPGGQYAGWTVMMARTGEEQLLVRFEPPLEFTDDNVRYLALSEGVSLTVPLELASIEANDLGEERANPAPLGETLVTDNWEVTILEVVRANEALVLVQEANQFNEAPDPGMEYIAVRARVRNIASDDEPEDISDSYFRLVDEMNVEYDTPSVVEPEPQLDIALYPGGEYEGWVVLQTSEGSTTPTVVFLPPFSFSEYYLSLVP